jgi:hypothetical protein
MPVSLVGHWVRLKEVFLLVLGWLDNNNNNNNKTVTVTVTDYLLKAWSASIRPDTKHEVGIAATTRQFLYRQNPHHRCLVRIHKKCVLNERLERARHQP